jgi:DNA-binding GntR family transcriptional regulator
MALRKARFQTLAQQAYEELQSQIMSGALPAGKRLLPELLAEKLAISQTPVKEALAALERDGLVEGASRRASNVRKFSVKDVEEIHQARILIELDAMSFIVANRMATRDFLAEMTHILEQLAASLKKPTKSGLANAIAHDCGFHERLVFQRGNRLVAGWHRTAIRQFQTARNFTLDTYPAESTIAGHSAILDALRGRDAVAAVAILRDHLEGSRAEMLARLSAGRAVPVTPQIALRAQL